MLVSRVFLGINVFEINIEGEGKDQLASVSTIMTGNVAFHPGGGRVLPYMGYMGMCRCEGYGFQAVYSRIGYINQSIWV